MSRLITLSMISNCSILVSSIRFKDSFCKVDEIFFSVKRAMLFLVRKIVSCYHNCMLSNIEGSVFMICLNMPVGISDFEKIRQNGYYYVDKSALISTLLKSEGTEVTLITRPRRFGKTMAMSMLAAFFDIRKNNASLFDGLFISHRKELCQNWLNQWPTVFFTFKDVDGLSFQDAYGMLTALIAFLFQQYDFLLTSEKTSEYDKAAFHRIAVQEASLTEIKTSFLLLTRMLHSHYGKPVILLMDEYDVPVAKAGNNGYYQEMLNVVKAMMSTALKDNPSLKFAVITGCLRITKESIFTGTNNFVSDSISSNRLNEYFGFTETDVRQILQDAGLSEHMDEIKAWYDGYHFGNLDVYCPWDVMNYVRDLQNDPKAAPASYWKNTSDNAIIRSFIDYAGDSITKKLETLLSGQAIVQKVEESLTYDYLHASEENLWSVLYLTGYLTKTASNPGSEPSEEGKSALVIPNAEIHEIFETTVKNWFDDNARLWDRQALFHAVWTGDCDTAAAEMNRLLRKTISYHDYKEDFYHAFFAGIFAGAGYMVESNKEHGEGRSDVIVCAPSEGVAAVFEIKYSKNIGNLSRDCDAALRQIDARMYAKDLEDDYDQVLCYGISFFKKRCVIKKCIPHLNTCLL